jgi:uncharacterized LabA/DUF88 family protein
MRVFELARELGRPSKEVITVLQRMGILVTSHAGVIDADTARKVREYYTTSARESSPTHGVSGLMRRVGVFIDVQNIYMCVKQAFGAPRVNYKALRDFLGREGAQVKMVAFTCYDPDDSGQMSFLHALAFMGYRVVAKPFKRMPDGNIKASMDIEMALEILSMAPHLDEVVLVTGDGDFAPLVDTLSRMGKVVKVIGPDRFTSQDLIHSCDEFINLSQIEGIFS